MYHKWLDRWDERRMRRGDDLKRTTELALDAELAFPAAKVVTDLGAFCLLAEQVTRNSDLFFGLAADSPEVCWQDETERVNDFETVAFGL
jgi:hypothetical protein